MWLTVNIWILILYKENNLSRERNGKNIQKRLAKWSLTDFSGIACVCTTCELKWYLKHRFCVKNCTAFWTLVLRCFVCLNVCEIWWIGTVFVWTFFTCVTIVCNNLVQSLNHLIRFVQEVYFRKTITFWKKLVYIFRKATLFFRKKAILFRKKLFLWKSTSWFFENNHFFGKKLVYVFRKATLFRKKATLFRKKLFLWKITSWFFTNQKKKHTHNMYPFNDIS